MDDCRLGFGLTPSLVLEIDIGMIAQWSGSIGSIPTGWFLCDGSRGTPDLRDRFSLASGPSFNVGDTGGSINHTHDFTSDGHTHNIPGGGTVMDGNNFADDTDSAVESGTTDPASVLPPFYALAFIQFQG